MIHLHKRCACGGDTCFSVERSHIVSRDRTFFLFVFFLCLFLPGAGGVNGYGCSHACPPKRVTPKTGASWSHSEVRKLKWLRNTDRTSVKDAYDGPEDRHVAHFSRPLNRMARVFTDRAEHQHKRD